MVVATQAPVETLRPLTIEDLEDFPDDGQRREIITGELVVTAAPTPAHQIVVGRLFRAIADYADRNGAGTTISSPVDVRLGTNDVVEPDIVFIARGREEMFEGKFIDGAPDLVVEVLSPSTQRTDLVRKRSLYARSEIREYWIVDPERKAVEVLRLESGAYQVVTAVDEKVKSPVLTGLELDTAALFASVRVPQE